MRRSGWWITTGLASLGVLTTCVLTGCADNGSSTPPANESAAQTLRQQLLAADPKSYVGLIIAARPTDQYVSVGDVPVKDFHEGDTFVLIDSNKKVIAHATVRAVTDDALHMKYEIAPNTGRDPRVGDLAVRFAN